WGGVGKDGATTSPGSWTRVLYPVPDPIVGGVSRPDLQSPYNNICNDVAIQPGTNAQVVIANCAWRGGAAYNGMYLSTDGARPFARINPQGGRTPQDIGRSQFAYSTDGSELYATVESITHYTSSPQTALSGIYQSHGGSIVGPWNKIGDSGKLASASSALHAANGYHPGIQAWYNQVI